ncbi:hypothetical protein BKA81DRAFT_382848 [Phyllosticta paracitricarpa]
MDHLVEVVIFPGRIFTGAIWVVQALWDCFSRGRLDPAPATTSPAYLTILKPDASCQNKILVVDFYQSRHRVSVIPQTFSEYTFLYTWESLCKRISLSHTKHFHHAKMDRLIQIALFPVHVVSFGSRAAQALWNILFPPPVIEPVVISEPTYSMILKSDGTNELREMPPLGIWFEGVDK